MISFEPKGTLPAFGEKLGFQVMPISREQAREILEAVHALELSKSADAPTVEQMIAQPDKGWYVGEVLGEEELFLYWGAHTYPRRCARESCDSGRSRRGLTRMLHPKNKSPVPIELSSIGTGHILYLLQCYFCFSIPHAIFASCNSSVAISHRYMRISTRESFTGEHNPCSNHVFL